MTTSDEPRYVRPGRSTNVFNEAVAAMTRAGISVWGSRILAVGGRKSGEWRTTPVNPLTLNGERYLVAPRGETQWVRNMRAAGGGELRVGRRAEPFTVTELADADKPPVLRAYLKRWKLEVGVFFDGVGADAPEAKLLEPARGPPVSGATGAAGAARGTRGVTPRAAVSGASGRASGTTQLQRCPDAEDRLPPHPPARLRHGQAK